MSITPNWRPIPEGEGDGSVEWTEDGEEFIDSYRCEARVILGGNGLWTAYCHVFQRKLDQRRHSKSAWRFVVIVTEFPKNTRQFGRREEAIDWCVETMTALCDLYKPNTPATP